MTQPPTEIPELSGYPAVMTVAQAAAVLQINDQVIRKKLNSGQWPGFRVGTRDWRMRRLVVRSIILGQDSWEAHRDATLPEGPPTHQGQEGAG